MKLSEGVERVRLFKTVRTAHLERAAQLKPATIVYADRRYDFDPELAARTQLVHAPGWKAALYLFRTAPRLLEINEPLMRGALRFTALALLASDLRSTFGGRRPRVVTYAIENLDPFSLPHPKRRRGRLGRRLDLALSRRVWRRVDSIVYGTAASREVYSARFVGPGGPESELIWALPSPADQAQTRPQKQGTRPTALFLGAFSERKGLGPLLTSWPAAAEQLEGAHLILIGKGDLQPLADDFAASRTDVTLIVDPPRDLILHHLRDADVLVLPSQPSLTWKEQVGLPIVEGLAYGCTIVTTGETGLAAWLEEHHHHVVSANGGNDALVQALQSAVSTPIDPALVAASLPVRDGRLAADDWLDR